MQMPLLFLVTACRHNKASSSEVQPTVFQTSKPVGTSGAAHLEENARSRLSVLPAGLWDRLNGRLTLTCFSLIKKNPETKPLQAMAAVESVSASHNDSMNQSNGKLHFTHLLQNKNRTHTQHKVFVATCPYINNISIMCVCIRIQTHTCNEVIKNISSDGDREHLRNMNEMTFFRSLTEEQHHC